MHTRSFSHDQPLLPTRRSARCWLSLLLWLVFPQLRAQVPAEIARLNQQLHPLTAVRAGNGFADLAPLGPVVAAARVVGLGECTHGTHEVFQFKHRLLEYLVTQQGFTTLALEVDYGWGEILNDYIQTGAGDSLVVRQAAGFTLWDTTEFWDMIRWMRAYNQTHTPKLRYVGIDMQDARPNLQRLAAFATQRADTVLQRQVRDLRTYYAALDHASPATKQHMVRLSDELVRQLQASAAPAAMQQHGQVLRQRAGMLLAPNGITFRDKAMATNLAWQLRQEPTAKVAVWAHNLHIQQAKAYPLMGQYLAKQLGSAYVAVGFTTGHGTASVFNEGVARALVLAPPLADSYEAWLDQANAPNYFLDLRQAAATSQWLTKSHQLRNIGAVEVPGGAEKQYMGYPPLPKAFDVLVYLRETSASQPYPAAHSVR